MSNDKRETMENFLPMTPMCHWSATSPQQLILWITLHHNVLRVVFVLFLILFSNYYSYMEFIRFQSKAVNFCFISMYSLTMGRFRFKSLQVLKC